ncbi:MAG TPA: NUDIX domain-containing protein [Anaerolineae bacterium]|nr:NUDIX domain-containing protein [Anaerolineae bacterium]
MRRCAGGILLKGRRIVLGKRAANREFYPKVWDIIGGRCDAGEEPEETLVREMTEEIGVVPRVFSRVAVLPEPLPELYGEAEYHIYVVTGWAGLLAEHGDEHAELRWFELTEAMKLDLALPAYRSVFAALMEGRGVEAVP